MNLYACEMSFGFGVGDFLASLKLAKHVADAIKSGPTEYKELQNQLECIRSIFISMSKDAKDKSSLLNRKGTPRKQELMGLVKNSKATMNEINGIVDKRSKLSDDGSHGVTRIWDAYQTCATDLAALCGRMTFHVASLNSFMLSLQGSALSRIETKIDALYAAMCDENTVDPLQSQASLASTVSVFTEIESNQSQAWNMLKHYLLEEEINIDQILAHRQGIIAYTKRLLEESGDDPDPDPAPEAQEIDTWKFDVCWVKISLISEEYVRCDGKDCVLLMFGLKVKREHPFISAIIRRPYFETYRIQVRHGRIWPQVIASSSVLLDEGSMYGLFFDVQSRKRLRSRETKPLGPYQFAYGILAPIGEKNLAPHVDVLLTNYTSNPSQNFHEKTTYTAFLYNSPSGIRWSPKTPKKALKEIELKYLNEAVKAADEKLNA